MPDDSVTVAIKRLPHGGGLDLPAYASAGAAGMDIVSAESVTIRPGARCAVATGFAMAIPQGFEMQVRPRSGLALKHGVTVPNTPGTIEFRLSRRAENHPHQSWRRSIRDRARRPHRANGAGPGRASEMERSPRIERDAARRRRVRLNWRSRKAGLSAADTQNIAHKKGGASLPRLSR